MAFQEQFSKFKPTQTVQPFNNEADNIIVVRPALSSSDNQSSSQRPDVTTEKLSEVQHSGRASKLSNSQVQASQGPNEPDRTINTIPFIKNVASGKNEARRSQVPINFVDYENTRLESIQSVDESSTCRRYSVNNLTVKDCKVQITTMQTASPSDTLNANMRTAINTDSSGDLKKATLNLSGSKQNLRYVVKEERPMPTAQSRNSNEDLLCFSRGLAVQTAQPSLDDEELTTVPAMQQKPPGGKHGRSGSRPSYDTTVGDRYSPSRIHNKKSKKDAPKLRLDEHLLSPFETDSGSRPSQLPTANFDALSLSGDFVHHMEIESAHRNSDMHIISTENNIYKKQEEAKSLLKADLNKVHELVMSGKAATSKPRKIVGLPDIEICQGREPRNALSLKINPETARVMEHSRINQEMRDARMEALLAQQPSPKSRRRRSPRKRSKNKKPVFNTETKPKEDDEEMDEGKCYIQNVLSKYLCTYDEFKQRQNSAKKSQTIDVNRSVELPPLRTPKEKTRVSLRDNMHLYVEKAKKHAGFSKLSQTPRVAQSIDFSKYKRAEFDKARIDIEMLSAERSHTSKDALTIRAIDLHLKDHAQDRSDVAIFRSEPFKQKIKALHDKQNAAFADFDGYMVERLDLIHSPFMPSDIAKQKRKKSREAEANVMKERMLKMVGKDEAAKAKYAGKNTRELAELLLNLSEDMKSDLATGGKSRYSTATKDIEGKDLEVDLSNFQIGGTPKNKNQAQMNKSTMPDGFDEDSEDIDGDEILNAFKIDPRLIEQSKALERGQLIQYQTMRKQIELLPTSMTLKQANKLQNMGNQHSEGDIPDDVIGNQLEMLKFEDSANEEANRAEEEISADIDAIKRSRLKRQVEEKVNSLEPVQIKDALQTVQEMNQRMKKANLQTLNELIDEFLSGTEKNDISPLMLVYEQLKENSQLLLPSRSLLEQDQRFFKQALNKLRKAQKIELRWQKTEAMQAARDFANKKAHEFSQHLTSEMREMHRQFNTVREKAIFFKNQNEKLTMQLVDYEGTIAELKNQVQNLHVQKHEEAQIIKLFDEENFVCERNHNQAFQIATPSRHETYDFMNKLKKDVGGDANFRNESPLSQGFNADPDCTLKHFAQMQSKYFERILSYQNRTQNLSVLWSSDHIRLPSKLVTTSVEENMMPLLREIPNSNGRDSSAQRKYATDGMMQIREEDSKMSGHLEIASMLRKPTIKKRLSHQSTFKRHSKMSNSQDSEDVNSDVPVIEKLQKLMQREDPLLKNKFSFYNSSISLNLDDRVSILKDEVINYYRGRMVQLEEYTGLIEQESNFFKLRSQKYYGNLCVCKEKIKELHQRIRHHIANHTTERLTELQGEREKYRQLEVQSEQTLKECKQVFSVECHVLEKLNERALADNREKTNLLRKFAFVLRVPRLHHEYIERNGIDPFVEGFTKLISENQTLKAELDQLNNRRQARNIVAEVKHKIMLNKSTPFTKALPSQMELLINQRNKYLGSALKEAKTVTARHKPELKTRRDRNEAVSKSMSVAKVAFKLERDDHFDASMSVERQSVFSSARVNVIVPSLQRESTHTKRTFDSKSKSPMRSLQKAVSSVLLQSHELAVHERSRTIGLEKHQGVLSQELIEPHNLGDSSHKTKPDPVSNLSSLKNLMQQTINKRQDFLSSRLPSEANENTMTGLTNQQSSTNFVKDSSNNTQSKTILHQAYMQALSQSSSMQDIAKQEIMPMNILARSDANLMRTRENFLQQYELTSAYEQKQTQHAMPPYRFALSSSIIESVDAVLENNSESKDYVRQSQKLQRSPIAKQLLGKNYIIELAQKAEQKHWDQGVKIHNSSEVTLQTLKESENILEQIDDIEGK